MQIYKTTFMTRIRFVSMKIRCYLKLFFVKFFF
jgi:hypothetical protein